MTNPKSQDLQTVRITSAKGIVVDAPVRQHSGPFAIHKPAFGERNRWHLTHYASGLRLAAPPTLKIALHLARELEALGDWAFVKNVDCPKVLKAAAWAVVKEYQ